MLLDRILGQPFSALVGYADGRRGRLGVLSLLVVLVALLPLANGNPPDPLWVPGVYDGADFDDVVVAIAATVALVERSGLLVAKPVLVVVGSARLAVGARVLSAALPAFHIRSPPR